MTKQAALIGQIRVTFSPKVEGWQKPANFHIGTLASLYKNAISGFVAAFFKHLDVKIAGKNTKSAKINTNVFKIYTETIRMICKLWKVVKALHCAHTDTFQSIRCRLKFKIPDLLFWESKRFKKKEVSRIFCDEEKFGAFKASSEVEKNQFNSEKRLSFCDFPNDQVGGLTLLLSSFRWTGTKSFWWLFRNFLCTPTVEPWSSSRDHRWLVNTWSC